MMIGQEELTAAQIIALEKQTIVQTYKRAPMVLSHGQGMTVWDTDGNAYLDFVAGIAVDIFGHADAGIAAALSEQAGKLIHTSNLYLSAPQVMLAQKLTENSFADKVFFTNSGTEANEGAIKFARKFARTHNPGSDDKFQIIVFEHAFHGRTMGSLAMTPKEAYQAPFRPLMPGVTVVELNDIDGIKTLMAEIGPQVCAIFVEPIQGEGGIHTATPEFLKTLRQLCDQYGALLVFDEVQCGLARTGDLWAHTASGVTPDIMTLAKPLAGGLPMGAILATDRVAAVLAPGDHGSTFSGGPLVSAVADHVFGRINNPAFLEHVRETGEYLMDRLSEINSPHIKEVRGRGLMVGIELDIEANLVIAKGVEKGVLLLNAGPNTLRLLPPLIVEREHVDTLIEKLTEILAEL